MDMLNACNHKEGVGVEQTENAGDKAFFYPSHKKIVKAKDKLIARGKQEGAFIRRQIYKTRKREHQNISNRKLLSGALETFFKTESNKKNGST